jgi:hypothetical protein
VVHTGFGTSITGGLIKSMRWTAVTFLWLRRRSRLTPVQQVCQQFLIYMAIQQREASTGTVILAIGQGHRR